MSRQDTSCELIITFNCLFSFYLLIAELKLKFKYNIDKVSKNKRSSLYK